MIRRAFAEFLLLPTLLVVGFAIAGVVLVAVDRADFTALRGIRSEMSKLFFNDPSATGAFLGTVAGALITVTGITFTVVLIAVQQSSSSLTHQVIDQFLRRRANQAFLGTFIGVALYSLAVLAATGPDLDPTLSASVGLLMTLVALYLLVLIVYTTLDQMRPVQIIEAIHDRIVSARDHQLELLGRTRRVAEVHLPGHPVRSEIDGFVTRLDLDAMEAALAEHPGAEIVLCVSLGTYVAHHDAVAEVRGGDADLADAVIRAVTLDRVRDVAVDPGYGVDQLVNIAWTTGSSSKQNPEPARLVVLTLRDMLGRWSGADADPGASSGARPAPIVYQADLLADVWDALEAIAVVCSESMQSQNLGEVVRTLTAVLPGLDAAGRERAASAALILLSGLDGQMLTTQLDSSLRELASAFEAVRPDVAAAIVAARTELARSVGVLNSRSARS